MFVLEATPTGRGEKRDKTVRAPCMKKEEKDRSDILLDHALSTESKINNAETLTYSDPTPKRQYCFKVTIQPTLHSSKPRTTSSRTSINHPPTSQLWRHQPILPQIRQTRLHQPLSRPTLHRQTMRILMCAAADDAFCVVAGEAETHVSELEMQGGSAWRDEGGGGGEMVCGAGRTESEFEEGGSLGGYHCCVSWGDDGLVGDAKGGGKNGVGLSRGVLEALTETGLIFVRKGRGERYRLRGDSREILLSGLFSWYMIVWVGRREPSSGLGEDTSAEAGPEARRLPNGNMMCGILVGMLIGNR